jgi:hypothetical protein
MTLKLSKRGRLYAAFHSPPKATDNGFPSHIVVRASEFPVRAALTGTIGPRKDQAQTGMCTGEGSSNMGERLYRRPETAFTNGRAPAVVFAPEFIYYLERENEGTLAQGDCGAEVDTSLIVPDPAAGGVGWCPVDVPGYTPLDIVTPPSAAQLAAAKLYPGGARHTIGNNIANMKSCILSNYSFVIGIGVFESFEDDSTVASGLIPFPNVDAEEGLGGHEMHSGLAFDDTIQCPNAPNPGAVLTENSWGVDWGIAPPDWAANLGTEKGLCWIPYDYLMNYNLASDVRMGHLGKAW